MIIKEFCEEIKKFIPRVENLKKYEKQLKKDDINIITYLIKSFGILTSVCKVTGQEIPQAQDCLTLIDNILTSFEKQTAVNKK